MKKATYTLTLEYDNGDKFSQGRLTQTRCYEMLKRYENRFWVNIEGRYIVAWRIDSGWKKTD